MQFILIVLAILIVPSHAETLTTDTKELVMQPGFAIIITLSRPYKTAVIGDPTVADINPQSDRVLSISARKLGTTNLIILDERGAEVHSANIIVGAREIGRVNVHSSGRDVQAYTPYQCTPVSCVRVKDELGVGRPGGVRDPEYRYWDSTVTSAGSAPPPAPPATVTPQ